MATYLETWNLRQSTSLANRFTVAVERAAWGVVKEDASVPNHAERMEWAKRMLVSAPSSEECGRAVLRIGLQAAPALATQGEAISDPDIQSIVEGLVTKLALAGV